MVIVEQWGDDKHAGVVRADGSRARVWWHEAQHTWERSEWRAEAGECQDVCRVELTDQDVDGLERALALEWLAGWLYDGAGLLRARAAEARRQEPKFATIDRDLPPRKDSDQPWQYRLQPGDAFVCGSGRRCEVFDVGKGRVYFRYQQGAELAWPLKSTAFWGRCTPPLYLRPEES